MTCPVFQEGNLKPPRPKTGVPPLARSRGSSRMRTPTEEQRYVSRTVTVTVKTMYDAVTRLTQRLCMMTLPV